LIANVVGIKLVFAEHDLEHGHNTSELEMVESLFKWLILINNGDVADVVDLVKTLNSVLNQLCQLHCSLHSI